MLVSVLIASRKRMKRLCSSVESIFRTATSKDFEVLVRFDDDDNESLNNLHMLDKFKEKLKYIVGPRFNGYNSHPVFMDELSAIAQGDWLFFLDDDGVILGKGWDEKLKNVPLSGKIVHPEFYWLGKTRYPSGSCVPVAICVPNKCWLKMGWDKLQFPIDHTLQVLLESQGWENEFLKDTIAFHRRDNDEVLKKHRELN